MQQMMHQQQQQQAQAGNPQGQMNAQAMHSMQQAQIAAQQHQQHQQAQQAQAQAAAAAAQQNQAQAQAQPQQQIPPNPQAQAQQPPPQGQQQPNLQQQQQAAAAAMIQQQQRKGEALKGQCLMRIVQFGDHLSSFPTSSRPLQAYMGNGVTTAIATAKKEADDYNYWAMFVEKFFAPTGVLRHSVWIAEEKGSSGSDKQYEIATPALARYFHTHFESGIKSMQLVLEKGTERDLPNGHYVESSKSSFVYWFDNGSQVSKHNTLNTHSLTRQLIASGNLRAHFDTEQKIELLEFVTSSHEEYIPRALVIEAARPLHEWGKDWKSLNAIPDGKQSPEMNKKKAKVMKSPQQPPPDIDLPPSMVKRKMGVTPSVFRFLEVCFLQSFSVMSLIFYSLPRLWAR